MKRKMYRPLQLLAVAAVFGAALLSQCQDVKAQDQVINDSSFIVGCYSYHLDREADYNESNYCFGVEHNGWVGMYYINSEDNGSFLGGYSKNVWQLSESVTGGAMAGFVTGYSRGDLVPFLAPKLSYDNLHVGADMMLIAYPETVVTFNLRFKF